MSYVIGVDLGTSAVKLLLVDQAGEVALEVSKEYPLLHEQAGYSEQRPDDWVEQTLAGLKEIVATFSGDTGQIEGISFSGQMHGLVLLDEAQKPLRPAILWNDTRTTAECKAIYEKLGVENVHKLTKNPVLEGFTLTKLLWVQAHEPELYARASLFMLPKDYVRLKLTGEVHTDFSDAAGTLLLDIEKKQWNEEMCKSFQIKPSMCPPLVEAQAEVGTLTSEIAAETGLPASVRVFAGGADNACGAIGAGILEEGKTLVSIGTSGVVLSYEASGSKDFAGKVHYFNHGAPGVFYTMGVTLAAGHSLSWFRQAFSEEKPFVELLKGIGNIPPGSGGLLFTPYLTGERTPHVDAAIRASFIGIDARHTEVHFVRAVLEGITFSLRESLEIFRSQGKEITEVVSIGGAVKSKQWLQMQADILNVDIAKLAGDQGPGMGAAMLAAVGCGWFKSLRDCAASFLKQEAIYHPNPDHVHQYNQLFALYRDVYPATAKLSQKLANFR